MGVPPPVWGSASALVLGTPPGAAALHSLHGDPGDGAPGDHEVRNGPMVAIPFLPICTPYATCPFR